MSSERLSHYTGVESHCRRVAALAVEIARRLRLPADAQETVEQASLFHHTPLPFLDPPALNRIMTDLCGEGWWRMEEMESLSRPLPEPVLAALRNLNAPPLESQVDRTGIIAEIIAVANHFDEQLEMLPFENKTVDQILDEFRAMSEGQLFLPEIVLGLMSIPRARMDSLLELAHGMTLHPAAALLALDDTAPLTELAASSEMLSEALLEVANSEPHKLEGHIGSAGEAIACIGPKAARKILMTAAMRPFFAATKRPDLWRHSLQVAQLAERLATISGRIDPHEAFLAGLVHDAGRVVLDGLTGEAFTVYTRMLKSCAPAFVERVLCRFDHAELGAAVLRQWEFPESIATAVRHHHEPEQNESELASVLYLAEYWSGSEEDLPSALRLGVAIDRTGLTLDLVQSAAGTNGLEEALIAAA